jgi:hypothetical protein
VERRCKTEEAEVPSVNEVEVNPTKGIAWNESYWISNEVGNVGIRMKSLDGTLPRSFADFGADLLVGACERSDVAGS